MTDKPLTQQDQDDLAKLNIQLEGEEQERSLLEVWQHVLSNIDKSANEPIPILVASRVVASWPFLTFQDTSEYHAVYHALLAEGRDLFAGVLADHPEATGWVGAEDAEHNHTVYTEVLVAWHNLLDMHEAAWRAEEETSHIWVAAIIDARAFFFSQTGLAGHLDKIGYVLSDDEFLNAVIASREEQSE